MYRYIALVWNTRNVAGSRAARTTRDSILSENGWCIAYEGAGALVLHTGPGTGPKQSYTLHGNSGVVLGNLFRTHASNPHSIQFGDTESQKIVSSSGRHLIKHYWGSYFALVHDADSQRHHVLRDPLGTLPCYYVHHECLEVFVYDIADGLRFLPATFSINQPIVSRWLISPALATTETGIEEIEEPLGGECLTFTHDGLTRSLLWNPTEIAGTPRFECSQDAANEVRSVVQSTINTWASCYERIVLHLSGGLDSSIVAGCLANTPSPPHVTYLNYSTDVKFDVEPLHLPGLDQRTADLIRSLAGTGDERYFARLVAERWKTKMIEQGGANSVDWRRLSEVPLKAMPTHYFGGIHADAVHMELIRTCGIQAFFSGEGGDTIFMASHQPLSSIDYAFLHGVRGEFWKHVLAACNLGKESFWSVLTKTVTRGLLHRSWQPNISHNTMPNLLELHLTQGLRGEDFEGPWAQLPGLPLLPPGKRRHVKCLGTPAYHHSVFRSGDYADNVDPLNSQPIWELMLQIPMYVVLCGGVSRGLARRAFAHLLPEEIRNRQVKGSGSPELQQLLRKNWKFVCEHLLGGLLIDSGYLNRNRVENCLTSEEPFMVVDAYHIANCLTAEIWMRQWQTVKRQGAPRMSAPIKAMAG